MKTAHMNAAIVGAMAVAALASGVLAVVELGRTQPEQRAIAFTFEVGEDAVASGLVESAKSQSDLERAATHARTVLTLSPYNNNARLRLAFIDSKLHGGKVSSAGAAYIGQSYDLVPYDPVIAAWRIRFALENWQELDIGARRAAQAEAYALGRGTVVSGKIRSSLQAVQDPVGRVSARLWLLVLSLQTP